MNENEYPIEHEPLRNILNALSEEESEATATQLRESLQDRGYNPDQLVADAKEIVADTVHKRRLAWQDEARNRLEVFREKQKKSSWFTKSKEEIERGFLTALKGDFGPQIQAAFRERTNLTTEDKAKIMDDYEQLGFLNEDTSDKPES